MCCHPTSQLEQISLWLQVRFACASSSCEADRGAPGDFEEIYGCPDEGNEHIGQWDAIVTCFFIDTVSPPLLVYRLQSICIHNQLTRLKISLTTSAHFIESWPLEALGLT